MSLFLAIICYDRRILLISEGRQKKLRDLLNSTQKFCSIVDAAFVAGVHCVFFFYFFNARIFKPFGINEVILIKKQIVLQTIINHAVQILQT